MVDPEYQETEETQQEIQENNSFENENQLMPAP
jgi:hypothetical protein